MDLFDCNDFVDVQGDCEPFQPNELIDADPFIKKPRKRTKKIVSSLQCENIVENNNNNTKCKKKRQPRKPTEKELLREYETEKDDNKNNNYSRNRTRSSSFAIQQCTSSNNNIHDFYQHMTASDKHEFDNKFTKPLGNQQDYVSSLENKKKKIVIVSGPAGTGKTLFATEIGVKWFLTGKCEKIIFTRPSVSVDEDLGYLPGTLEEKLAPFVRPIYDIMYNFMSPKELQHLMDEKIVEIAPLGFMRGRTFKNCWIVADEMQNSTVNQMKMLLTRLGTNSRLIITGDLEQFDRANQMNGLEDFLNKFRGKKSVNIVTYEFNKTDVQREEVVKEVLQLYDTVL